MRKTSDEGLGLVATGLLHCQTKGVPVCYEEKSNMEYSVELDWPVVGHGKNLREEALPNSESLIYS